MKLGLFSCEIGILHWNFILNSKHSFCINITFSKAEKAIVRSTCNLDRRRNYFKEETKRTP